MSAAAVDTPSEDVWVPKVNPWIIAGAVSLAAFMEVLDTSIANVALPHIAGGLAASNDESTWVLTSYLVSNAIVLPLSGWLVASLGRKRFFLICITFFTVSSFLCGIAPSLGFLLLFRVMQGAFGGGLQPMAQSILGDSFAPEKRGLAFSLYGITTICAPAIGPTLGGWITDNYSWRWIFYINVPVGILALILVYQLVEDPPYIARLKARLSGFDFIGFSLLTVGVGALQIVLDKGQEDDWFGSHFITTLVVIAVVGLVSLVIWEWFQKQPIVDVRLFKNFNVATTNLMFLMLGAALFSSTVLMPQLLQTLMGYTAQKAGNVLSAGALVVLVVLPMVGKLTTRFQARHIIAFGWIGLAVAMYISSKQVDLRRCGSRFFGYLGMVSETAHRGCAFVQELQRRDYQFNVPNAGSGVIQFHSTDAATSPDSDGIHGTKGRECAFRRCPTGMYCHTRNKVAERKHNQGRNKVGSEPVVFLSLVEDDLQCAHAQGQQRKSDEVEAREPGLQPGYVRWIFDKLIDQ
jgi:DHA2 family multidrug resistance protein